MKILECIKVGKKLKVQIVGESGDVQFPKKLISEGKKFATHLTNVGSFWKVSGEIYELTPIKESCSKEYFAITENNGYEGESWTFFISKKTKHAKEIAAFLMQNPNLEIAESFFRVEEVSESFVFKSLSSKLNRSGYFNTYNYASKLNPPPKNLSNEDGQFAEYLYKAQFVNTFEFDFKKLILKNKIEKI